LLPRPDSKTSVCKLFTPLAIALSHLPALLTVEEATANANSVVREVSRVLAPGGVFIVVSYEPPAGRRSVLEADDATWHLEVAGEEDEMGNYIYVCRKVGLELGTLDATLMGEEGSLIEVD